MNNDFYDIIIIGGGINGAGILLDLSLRGFKTALFEKNDFSSGTTSKSTKLIHGGLRYLEYFEFSLVFESLQERELLLQNAAHLVFPLPLLLPTYKNDKNGFLLKEAGMILYDLLSFNKSMPHHSVFLKSYAKKSMTINKQNLQGASMYYDCQVPFPERLCLENILRAKKYGAEIFNYAKVEKIKKEKDFFTTEILNKKNNEKVKVKSKIVINATGPWVDETNNLFSSTIDKKIGGTKGSHIIISKSKAMVEKAVYVEARSDGRPFFIIPWNNYTLIGTTDTPYKEDLNLVSVNTDEINYLLNEANFVLKNNLTKKDILFTYSGVRPLPYLDSKTPAAITRRHIIYDHKKEGADGYISIIGGKLTTYRSLAKQVGDLVSKKLNKQTSCKTSTEKFLSRNELTKFLKLIKRKNNLQLSENTLNNLIYTYGKNTFNILNYAKKENLLQENICKNHPNILAEVAYSIDNEFTYALQDFFLRRSCMGLSECRGLDCVEKIAKIFAEKFKWDKKEKEKNLESYFKTMNTEFKKEF